MGRWDAPFWAKVPRQLLFVNMLIPRTSEVPNQNTEGTKSEMLSLLLLTLPKWHHKPRFLRTAEYLALQASDTRIWSDSTFWPRYYKMAGTCLSCEDMALFLLWGSPSHWKWWAPKITCCHLMTEENQLVIYFNNCPTVPKKFSPYVNWSANPGECGTY